MGVFPTTILLATDGSDEAKLATQAATELSRDTGSELHVVYVLPAPAQLIGHHLYSQETKESVIAGAERDAEVFLKEQAEQIGANGGKVAERHFRAGGAEQASLRP